MCSTRFDVNIMDCSAAGACDIIQNGGQDGPYIGSYSKIRIHQKTTEIENISC